MEANRIADAGRCFAGMAQVCGPDPKAVKMRRSAFHLHQSGVTTLSASAILFPLASLRNPPPFFDHVRVSYGHNGDIALAPASLVEPFLVAEQRNSYSEELHPRLLPDAHIDILFEGETSVNYSDEKPRVPRWLPTQLLALVDIQEASVALLSLLGADRGSNESSPWDIGWSLAHANQKPVENGIKHSIETLGNYSSKMLLDVSTLAKSATRVAILGIPTLKLEETIYVHASIRQEQGDKCVVVGSPFGILSPFHFFNSVSVGTVSNCLSAGYSKNMLLMVDIRCLPGMEGAPMFDRHFCLMGMLMSPLRQKGSNAEVQLVITWDAIAAALGNRFQMEPQHEKLVHANITSEPKDYVSSCNHGRSGFNTTEGFSMCDISASLKRALSSIVLVTFGGSWASGVVLSTNGLVLTNAHLLEPWRFGRTSSLGLKNEIHSCLEHTCNKEKIEVLRPQTSRVSDYEEPGDLASFTNFSLDRDKKLLVRLDREGKQIWCGATAVYVSKGPLDVALLQLKTIPIQLSPVNPQFICPLAGESVYAVGHGLFPPRSGLVPSISSGTISNVVRLPASIPNCQSTFGTAKMDSPIMIQTTAAVYPGASGGALFNSDGQMVGLITSNARHGEWSIIPRMNFSIPCESLEPIFKYSESMEPSLLKQMDRPNELISSSWSLAPRMPLLLDDPLVRDNREDKVMKFRKFLAEKSEEIKSKSFNEFEKFSSKNITSKI